MNKTREEWQKSFIKSLILFRDYFFTQEPSEIVGKNRSSAISSILIGYFCERRIRVPIKEPSPYMSCEDMAIYINNEVLSYIYDEQLDFIDLDWREMYVLKEDTNDFLADGDNEEEW
jgi:hypothetical protein